jgi:hypothetical protein
MNSNDSALLRHGDSDGWASVWIRVLSLDRDRMLERGRGRERVERLGNDVARVALDAPSADDPAVQQLIMQMSLVIPYVPFDRSGFLLAATAALAWQSDNTPERTGEALARLYADLQAMNLRTAEASFAAAQRDVERQAKARTQTADAELLERYRSIVMALAGLASEDGRWSDSGIDGDEGRFLQVIAARLYEPRRQADELAQARRELEESEQEKWHLAEQVRRLQQQLVSRRRPEPVLLRSWQDAERHAAKWMHYLGYADAAVTPPGPDGGVDVAADRAIAQVKAEGHLTGSAVIRQLAGLTVGGTHRGKACLLFSTFGYSRDALSTAEEIGAALFRLADGGEAVAESTAAKRMLEAAAGPVPISR